MIHALSSSSLELYICIYWLHHKLSVHCCTFLLYNFEHVKTQFVADDCTRKERNFVKHYVGIIYIYIYKHTYIYTCIHTYIHAYIYTYIHSYIHTYIHIYIYTYRQTDRQTYIHTIYIYFSYGHYSNWLRTTKSYCKIFSSKDIYIYTHVCVFDTY